MLWRMTVENFYSIREPITLDLTVGRNVPEYPDRLVEPIPGRSERVSRVAAIFGPNASGKTNVLRALSFLKDFVQNSFDWNVTGPSPYLRFESHATLSAPTRFRIDFDGELIQDAPRSLYSYELDLRVDAPGQTSKVLYEALKYFPKGRPRKLFERREKDVYVSKYFNMKKNDQRLSFVKSNASLISSLAHFNHDFSLAVVQNLTSVNTNVGLPGRVEYDSDEATKYYSSNPKVFESLVESLKILDIGIEKATLEVTNYGVSPKFWHMGLDNPIVYQFESDGTKNFYRIFPQINYVLETGGLAILDEFDRDIHPVLVPEIVRWFHDPEINRKNGQIIMSVHSVPLMEYLIKEEVFFTSKKISGATHLYGLKEVKGVRRDENIYAKYLGGQYGSIPQIG